VTTALTIIGAVALFIAGLRLSAFFSGAETGFYRLSMVRLGIDVHSGDPVAKRLLWFARNPAYFVATTLVGNNVANYVTTLAIGITVGAMAPRSGGWLEVVVTVLIAPIVFIFGELVPKNLYYRAPMSLLRGASGWFVFYYRLFFLATLPLISISKWFERIGGVEDRPSELVLGRSRLVQVLGHGHREGVLSDVQSLLVHGLLHTATVSVSESMTPVSRILGVSEDTSRDETLAYAASYGINIVPVHRANDATDWFGYLRVVDLTISTQPVSALLRTMPTIEAGRSKLETLITLGTAGAEQGTVREDAVIVGIVSAHGLAEQLFRPPRTADAPRPDAD